jgi:hypothetical protein
MVLPGSHDKYISPNNGIGTAHFEYDVVRTGIVLDRLKRFEIAEVGIHVVDVEGPHVYAAPVTMVAPPCVLADSEVAESFTTVPAASSEGIMGFSESTMRPEVVSTMSVERQRP